MNKNVWLFPQNAANYEQFMETLKFFENNNGASRNNDLQQALMTEHSIAGKYNPYIEKRSFDTSSANHKIDEPRFYGALYETPNKKIHLSTYGELLLKYENDELKFGKIFIAMLYRIQFDNPYKKMEGFDIYPLRLIFKLLVEERINNILYADEVSYILYNIKNVKNEKIYNEIVNQILDFRVNNIRKRKEIVENDAEQFVKNLVCTCYLFKMLEEFKIVNANSYEKMNIKSPARKKETSKNNKGIKLKEKYINFVNEYNLKFPYYQEVIKIQGLKSDWLREIYNYVPITLLEEIDEKEDVYMEFVQIPKVLLDSSKDGTKWAEFEEYLKKAFNLFVDVEAERISGAGETDVLCYYSKEKFNFCADAKATHKKLAFINDGRLKQHRALYDSKYTILVTPGYVPSAAQDIRGTETCILTSSCFADLISKYVFKLYKRRIECSYEVINDIIINNLGTDVSDKIYDLIDETIGV